MTRVPATYTPVVASLGGGTSGTPRRSPKVIGSALIALTKPRIIELLLVTTVPTMVVAARGVPSVWLIVATLVGGTLAAACDDFWWPAQRVDLITVGLPE